MLRTISGDLIKVGEVYITQGAGAITVTKVQEHPSRSRFKVYFKMLGKPEGPHIYQGTMLIKGRGFISYDINGRFCTEENNEKFPWHLIEKVVEYKIKGIAKGLAALSKCEKELTR